MKSVFEYMSEEEYARYNELMDKAKEAKANAPKAPRAPRVVSKETQIKRTENQVAKLQAKLAALLGTVEDDTNDDMK